MDQDEMKAYFLATYDSYADELYRYCRMRVSDGERAQDLVQDVFVRFWQSLRDGTVHENPRAFLYTLARNRVIDWYRKKKETSLDALQEEGVDFAAGNQDDIVRDAEMQQVLAAVNELDDRSRDAILLRFVEGWSPQEIAELNNESANAVSVRINRAISKVRTIIHVKD